MAIKNIKLSNGQTYSIDADVVVDPSMSDTSANAVENKVIKAYVDTEINDLKKNISNTMSIIDLTPYIGTIDYSVLIPVITKNVGTSVSLTITNANELVSKIKENPKANFSISIDMGGFTDVNLYVYNAYYDANNEPNISLTGFSYWGLHSQSSESSNIIITLILDLGESSSGTLSFSPTNNVIDLTSYYTPSTETTGTMSTDGVNLIKNNFDNNVVFKITLSGQSFYFISSIQSRSNYFLTSFYSIIDADEHPIIYGVKVSSASTSDNILIQMNEVVTPKNITSLITDIAPSTDAYPFYMYDFTCSSALWNVVTNNYASTFVMNMGIVKHYFTVERIYDDIIILSNDACLVCLIKDTSKKSFIMYNDYPNLFYFDNHNDVHFNTHFARYLIENKSIFSLVNVKFLLSRVEENEYLFTSQFGYNTSDTMGVITFKMGTDLLFNVDSVILYTILQSKSDNLKTTSKEVIGAINEVNTNLSSHTLNTNNPHSVTKTQVGLGSVVNAGQTSVPTESSNGYFTAGGAYTLQQSLNSSISTKQDKLTDGSVQRSWLDASTLSSLSKADSAIQSLDGYATEEFVTSTISTHNDSSSAHSDIRGSISTLSGRVDTAENEIDTLQSTVSGLGNIPEYTLETGTTDGSVVLKKDNVVVNSDVLIKGWTELKNLVESKQDKTDNSLNTTSKTIVGAINEINAKIPALPEDATTKTYVLKAVNGVFQWVEEAAA